MLFVFALLHCCPDTVDTGYLSHLYNRVYLKYLLTFSFEIFKVSTEQQHLCLFYQLCWTEEVVKWPDYS